LEYSGYLYINLIKNIVKFNINYFKIKSAESGSIWKKDIYVMKFVLDFKLVNLTFISFSETCRLR